jgi:two-component system, chemotaxis family, protein-glutamate methylesterase/glutaminase
MEASHIPEWMFARDIIAIAASSGGVVVLPRLSSSFPPDLPASAFVALHIPPEAPGLLPEIIHHTASLSVARPPPGERKYKSANVEPI